VLRDTHHTGTSKTPKQAGSLQVWSAPLSRLGDDRRAEWQRLFESQQGLANPFSSPVWVCEWLAQYVPVQDQRVLWIAESDRLVGVAPMYVQQVGAGRLPVGRRLTMVGGGRTTPLELPQLLTAPGYARAVSRAVITHTLTQNATWAELSLGRDQGWFPVGTYRNEDMVVTFKRQQRSRACVVLELADTWEATRAGLRRNIKESLRRARNRLAKDGRPWKVHQRTGTDLDTATVDRLLGLHSARSSYDGSWSRHHDAFANDTTAELMRRVLPLLGAQQEATVLELELADQVVAAQLVLHAPGTIYFHSSGFVPDVWELSPVTFLQGEAIQAAITRGDRWVNFSPGPNEAKLRWSDILHVVDDFAYGSGGRGALSRYAAFTLGQEVRDLVHTRRQALEEKASVAR
jgi:CelD/BcsL family acetyltransferase involved in cellulose biosynthesis